MKTTLIEKLSREGQYGMTTDAMILDTDTHGRLLISDGWCGGDVRGFCYRWEGGVAVQLKADDTFGALTKSWNDYMDTLDVVLQGQDSERPMFFGWTGHAIAAIAKRHA